MTVRFDADRCSWLTENSRLPAGVPPGKCSSRQSRSDRSSIKGKKLVVVRSGSPDRAAFPFDSVSRSVKKFLRRLRARLAARHSTDHFLRYLPEEPGKKGNRKKRGEWEVSARAESRKRRGAGGIPWIAGGLDRSGVV